MVHLKMYSRLLAGALFIVTLAACATGNPGRRPYLITENLDRADKHLAAGRAREAAEMYHIVLLADPINQRAAQGVAAAGQTTGATSLPTLLGVNERRVVARPSLAWAIGLYPINRLLDLADIVSFHVGLEGGAMADVHLTRMLQLGLGGGGGMQVGWWQKRDLGLGVGHAGEVALLPASATQVGFARLGTAGRRSDSYTLSGINTPTDPAFQRQADYWGCGVQVIALLAGASVEFHPVELVDALGGFFLIDFLHDDLGQSAPLKLDANDRAAMQNLIDTLTTTEIQDNLDKISER
jgi:hypothetical protein